MLRHLSQRLLSLLQLTRMALVFTAIADGWCTLLLAAQRRAEMHHTSLGTQVDTRHFLAAAAVSVGLYGFGMSLNDIIDRRRDQQISPNRPLPSGRLGVVAAHVVCGLLIVGAVSAGALYGRLTADWTSLVLVVWTGMLIAFYDLAGKYLVALGLLTLGLIRFFHALIFAPTVPLLWHPLWLLNHVAVLSAVAYWWEEKRPPLTRGHWVLVLGGLLFVNAMLVSMIASRQAESAGSAVQDAASTLRIQRGLIPPAVATAGFVLLAWRVRRRSATPREAGQATMLYGLLWLIVYDAAFVAGYVRDWAATAAILLLLPVAYLSVRVMRWWSQLMALSQRPSFKRART
jgi:4-hydroxybenzoate polyprenyltransferase